MLGVQLPVLEGDHENGQMRGLLVPVDRPAHHVVRAVPFAEPFERIHQVGILRRPIQTLEPVLMCRDHVFKAKDGITAPLVRQAVFEGLHDLLRAAVAVLVLVGQLGGGVGRFAGPVGVGEAGSDVAEAL